LDLDGCVKNFSVASLQLGRDVTVALPRTSLQVTLSVWRALFMREALGRLATGRAGWLWLLLEPVAHVGMLMVLFSLLQRGNVPGIDFALFVAVGLLGFKSFMYTGSRSAAALAANKGLLGYRQVKPVDAVLVRAALEGVINAFVTLVLLALAVLVGFDAVPHDPITVIVSYALLWLLGVGFGLTVSVGTALVPEIEKIVGLISTPLYFASGVFFSPGLLPPQAQEWLLYNPIVHGLELARSGFFPNYSLAQGVSDGYLAASSLGMVLLGLALQRRFAVKLAAQ
jgi:capsular polysaccharide transport system permease protein